MKEDRSTFNENPSGKQVVGCQWVY